MSILGQFGFYTLLPLTAPKIVSEPHEAARPADIYAGDDPCEITIGDYNVRVLAHRPLLYKCTNVIHMCMRVLRSV